MAKPILLIKSYHDIPREEAAIVQKDLEVKLDYEYHVLFLPITNGELLIEVLNVDKVSETDIEELKKKIKEDIEKLCHQ